MCRVRGPPGTQAEAPRVVLELLGAFHREKSVRCRTGGWCAAPRRSSTSSTHPAQRPRPFVSLRHTGRPAALVAAGSCLSAMLRVGGVRSSEDVGEKLCTSEVHVPVLHYTELCSVCSKNGVSFVPGGATAFVPRFPSAHGFQPSGLRRCIRVAARLWELLRCNLAPSNQRLFPDVGAPIASQLIVDDVLGGEV